MDKLANDDSGIQCPLKTPVIKDRTNSKVEGIISDLDNLVLKPKPQMKSSNSSMRKTSASDTELLTPPKAMSLVKDTYTDIMYQRWHKSNGHLPELDRTDIDEECPLFNQGLKPSPTRQQHPEFAQSSYERIRFHEDKLTRIDYTEGDP